MDIWLLTSEATPDGIDDDAPLFDALVARGARPRWVVWSDPAVDWSAPDRLLLRTPWDYVPRIDAFRRFLVQPAIATKLINPVTMVTWNLDKIYLAELAARGVPVIPTRWIAPGEQHVGDVPGTSTEIVVKPRISAGARHSLRVRRDEADRIVLDGEITSGWLAQPLLDSVLDRGEVSAIRIDGEWTHAVRKWPAAGDYRVQARHGGRLAAAALRDEELHVAERAIAALDDDPLYARVDLVDDEHGDPVVIELELIEPQLFFGHGAQAAVRMADALLRNGTECR